MKRNDNSFVGNVILIVFVIGLLFYSFNHKGISQVLIINLNESNTLSVNGPQFIPFGDTGQLLDGFNQGGCNTLAGTFSNLNGPVEIGPALDFAETGPRTVIGDGFQMSQTVIFNFPTTDPFTGEPLDPSMNQLGISVVPGGASSFFDVFFEIDCGTGTITGTTSTSSSSTSSSGSTTSSSGSTATSSGSVSGSSSGSVTDPVGVITLAISSEEQARNTNLSIPDLAMGGGSFSVSNAITQLNASLGSLNSLSTQLSGSTIRFAMGMTTIQEKIMEVIDLDNQAIELLNSVSNKTPDIADGEFTQPVARARELLKKALRCKAQIIKKLQRVSRQEGMSDSGMSDSGMSDLGMSSPSMSSMSGSGMSSMAGMSGR